MNQTQTLTALQGKHVCTLPMPCVRSRVWYNETREVAQENWALEQ